MPRNRKLIRASIALAAALLIQACAGPQPRPAPVAPLAFSGAQCLGDLDARAVGYEIAPTPASAEPCAIDTPVRVTRAEVPWNQPALMSCALADRMDRFLAEAVEPLARRYLHAQVARLDHFGAYACRRETGQAGRWSEHAAGRAIDIAGFELADGERISVEADWHGGGPRRAFLVAVARRACDYFNVVLTPDSDRYHYNHLHLDIGPYRLCER